ncbi:MAG: sulfatase [Lentisphaerae bacterium RIFOXYB12_FULL_65_16]|nr:MAG: sulfatase [Lentisphaerae bacterium RIFOXYA12_64_32]OGV84335.1 MAG: sulfatase [Lentisphaerae bacterium RIFOXYB12_FULL_65_16]
MPPNIIFMLMDDLGWKDLGCCGSEFYETPNLDRLAAEGMRFRNAYSASPVCSPARASIMTGRYPARVGVTDWICWRPGFHPCKGRVIDAPYVDHLPLSEVSVARALRDGGYQTWHVGKWHLGGPDYYPDKHGFDINVGGCEWGSPSKGYFSPWSIPNFPDGPKGEYLTDRLAAEAVRLIRQTDGRPFFLNFWDYLVHTPIQGKPEYVEYFKAKAQRLGLDKVKAIEEGEVFPCEHKKHLRVQRRILQSDPVYAAMVKSMDDTVGKLRAAVEAIGQADNTVFIFTSDNGGLATAEGSPTCNLPLSEGKGWMYEGGTREALLVWGPGRIRAGSVCDVPVTGPDFYPTMLEMAGLPLRPAQHCDGVSLMPLLNESGSLDRDALFWHYPHYGNQGGTPGASVRAGDVKLIEFFEDRHVELYSLAEDPAEDRDLASIMPEKAAELRDRLHQWLASTGAKFPAPNPTYQP